MMPIHRSTLRALALSATAGLVLSSCTLLGGDEEPSPAPAPAPTQDPADEGTATGGSGLDGDNATASSGNDADRSTGTAAAPTTDEVVLVTHSSFTVPEELVAAFETETGWDLTIQSSGDAGELTNRLVLTSGSPIGDVVFGIDNTYASRAVDEGVLAAYTPSDLPESAEEHALEGGAAYLTPVDFGDVCVRERGRRVVRKQRHRPAGDADRPDGAGV
ncbi:hypothetical protein [Ornithinimicrobium sp. W1665]|uniref:hypothetical protein n=1 Tax=Ornithinimicrobium sp. W1665 TaxID=3416666 RepID=UPI003D6AF48D